MSGSAQQNEHVNALLCYLGDEVDANEDKWKPMTQ